MEPTELTPEAQPTQPTEHAVPPVMGYRPLSDMDVELINAIKAKGNELIQLFQHVGEMVVMKERQLWADCHNAETRLKAAQMSGDESAVALAEEILKNAQTQMNDFQISDAMRWAHIGRTDIQTGVMALVRAVAQPVSLI
ncbi:TPA: hypothetical protein ACODIZ_003618 [Salmonella enterica subsp. enterica serovar Newport]